MSNLASPDPCKTGSLSHNQTIQTGPTLNKKISTALLQLRFNEYILCYDLVKAFLQLKLTPEDSNKLCFLWFRNIAKEDYTIVGYRITRVPFGLRCSPALLMIGLYKILMIDSVNDSNDLRDIKRSLSNLLYMDNGAISSNTTKDLEGLYGKVKDVFAPYQFKLQQFITNSKHLQDIIDDDCVCDTPVINKVLGVEWNRAQDTLNPPKYSLNIDAQTKRQVLQSIASNYDTNNLNAPMLNRARLFLHQLQCRPDLMWDSKISNDQQREWRNISRQVNASQPIAIDRCIGRRDDSYDLIACVDSSKQIYGAVIYAHNLRTNKMSLVCAKNRILNSKMESRTIPSLELQSIELGTEVLIEHYQELCGETAVEPLEVRNLVLYSDSSAALSWLHAYSVKFDKMNNKSVFVNNRLDNISRLCRIKPVCFKFCAGSSNPADCITRCLSRKQLLKSRYFIGPEVSELIGESCVPDIIIPNPILHQYGATTETTEPILPLAHILPIESHSDIRKVFRIYGCVLECISKWKRKARIAEKVETVSSNSLMTEASKACLLAEQSIKYGEVVKYFSNHPKQLKAIPDIVTRLNLFIDEDGLIRVKCKFKRWRDGQCFPILLAKDSHLTNLIVIDAHHQLKHAGVYTLLSRVRSQFYIPSCFSTVKRVLKGCIDCRRYNSRTIKLNQGEYRDFRLSPPNVPFRYLFLDYIGPFTVKLNQTTTKVYLLCLTCMWSRAVNLVLTRNLTLDGFLKAFQTHCYSHGVPEYCVSDCGSQIVPGGNVIQNFINDPQSRKFFEENGVSPIKFEQFPVGSKKLGGMVEICVKLVKRVLNASIHKLVLDYFDFEMLVAETVSIVNKRPVSFKDALRDNDVSYEIPDAISPEMLMKGYELVSLNLVPGLQPTDEDPDFSPLSSPSHISKTYDKLRAARTTLVKLYNGELRKTLIQQATNVPDRYKPADHKSPRVGDILLIKEPLLKPVSYPMGIVRSVIKNSLGEVTEVAIIKGSTRELLRRHVTSLIPLLSVAETNVFPAGRVEDPVLKGDAEDQSARAPRRRAAVLSEEATRALQAEDMI